jgi:hypothetical protein
VKVPDAAQHSRVSLMVFYSIHSILAVGLLFTTPFIPEKRETFRVFKD